MFVMDVKLQHYPEEKMKIYALIDWSHFCLASFSTFVSLMISTYFLVVYIEVKCTEMVVIYVHIK